MNGELNEALSTVGFAETRDRRPPGGLDGPDDSIESLAGRQVALIDLLDRLLTGGRS